MMDVDSDAYQGLDSDTAEELQAIFAMRSAEQREEPQNRLCTTCKKQNHSWFKNCDGCREKNRNRNRLSELRRQQRNQAQYQPAFSDDKSDNRHSAPSGSSGRSGEENLATRPGDAPPAKKRKANLISDLDGKERDVALQEMKNGLKRKFGEKVVAPLAKPTQSSGREYQTASSLYDTLRREVQVSFTSEFQFSGYHKIVVNQEINNRKRTKMVVDDMRKIARVPFELGNVQKSKSTKTNAYGLSYPCACLGYDQAPAAPIVSSKSSLKGTQGDLIRQARARNAEAAPINVRRECGGRVYVITKDDNSHPLGIPGQKITVGVQHT